MEQKSSRLAVPSGKEGGARTTVNDSRFATWLAGVFVGAQQHDSKNRKKKPPKKKKKNRLIPPVSLLPSTIQLAN